MISGLLFLPAAHRRFGGGVYSDISGYVTRNVTSATNLPYIWVAAAGLGLNSWGRQQCWAVRLVCLAQ